MSRWFGRVSGSTSLLAVLFLLWGCHLSRADYRLNCAAGNICTFKSTDAGGVSTPEFILGTGGNIIGTVKIDQTTPGTTNGVVVNSSALATGAAIAAKQPALGTAATPSTDVITTQPPGRATYSAYLRAVAFTATGTIFQIQGSATKTIRVTHLSFSGTQTTASMIDVTLMRTTGGATGGSPVTFALSGGGIAKHDPLNDASPTATLSAWSTPPSGSAGTAVGGFRAAKAFTALPTAAHVPVDWKFDNVTARALYLRGTSDYLELFLTTSSAFSGASFDIYAEWTEE